MNEERYERRYLHLAEAYYAENELRNAPYKDEVYFGLYAESGGTRGEAFVRWYYVDGLLSPQLQIYGESWFLIALFTDTFYALAHIAEKDIQPKQFCRLLEYYGFVDATKRTKE